MKNDDFMKSIKDLDLPTVQPTIPAALNDMYDNMRAASEIIAKNRAEKDAAIFRTAAESEAQTELLNNQLCEVKAQNELLRENYSTLKELYDKVKEEAEESRKEAAKSRKREKVAIWVAIASPLLCVLASVLIALFL